MTAHVMAYMCAVPPFNSIRENEATYPPVLNACVQVPHDTVGGETEVVEPTVEALRYDLSQERSQRRGTNGRVG